ncbi:MAG: hypothetical protein VX498_06535 [Myxococcota bacterium]|nr:hypothetical protein [Myxococcota bacterium]
MSYMTWMARIAHRLAAARPSGPVFGRPGPKQPKVREIVVAALLVGSPVLAWLAFVLFFS